jgi:hypothetical protein
LNYTSSIPWLTLLFPSYYFISSLTTNVNKRA